MTSNRKMVVAAKCAPVEEILVNVEKAGLTAAELYTILNGCMILIR